MFVVYFILVHKRVMIGKTTNLYSRIVQYERTGCNAEVLGLIFCHSEQNLAETESKTLSQFQFCKCEVNHDVFYFCPEMLSWIIDNTTAFTNDIKAFCRNANRNRIARYNTKKSEKALQRQQEEELALKQRENAIPRPLKAKEMLDEGIAIGKIAKHFGVSRQTINNDLKRISE